MSKIPESFIDDLVNKIDIVDIINLRVPLKQKGHEFSACCPFHNEKTPSFTVSPQKQFYHCFGCGAHGSAIGFLMQYENLSFVEAIESLASSIGVTVVREQDGYNNYEPRNNPEELTALLAILDQANNWFYQQLLHHANKNQAIEYLKDRGLSGEIIREYHIGFAPQYGLLDSLGSNEESKKLLLDAGLLAKNDKGELYERFRNRIQFPIYDFKGRVIGFGGRTLINDKAKYYNSPETKLFHKGKELYGLYKARKYIKQQGLVLVVEGYMDVVALAQFDVRYAVATLGTATSFEHLKLLFRISDKIVCCFDGDKAGVGAAIKAMKEVLPLMRDGRTMAFMFLPNNEDPDSFIRQHGKEKFEILINRAKPLDKFMFAYLQNQVSLTSIDGRAKLADLAKPLLKQFTQGVYFELMLEKLAKLTQMNEDKLRRYINLNVSKTSSKNRRKIIQNYQNKTNYESIHKLLALLISNPELAIDLSLDPIFLQSKHHDIKFLLQTIKIINNNTKIHTGLLHEKLRELPNAETTLNKVWQFGKTLANLVNYQDEFTELLNNIAEQIKKNKRATDIQQLSSGADINKIIKSRQSLNDS